MDDDGFISASFHRFLVQGLGPYLSSGMAFSSCSSAKEIDANEKEENGSGFSCKEVLSQAGLDMIQLLAMAVCPNPPSFELPVTITSESLSMDADRGAGGEPVLHEVRQLATSTMPLAFQLSYSDRLQLVDLCTELAIPENGDAALDTGYAATEASSNTRVSNGNTADLVRENSTFQAVLCQLCTSLYSFASYSAHSDKDAKVAYGALANVAITEGNASTVQVEFQRLLMACIESRSEYLSLAIADCLAEMITKYNGSRYYADGAFVRFALGLLGKCLGEKIKMGVEEGSSTNYKHSQYDRLIEEHTSKRQKMEETNTTSSNICKPYHYIALLRAARPLFYFILDIPNKPKEEDGIEADTENEIVNAEAAAKAQLIRDATLLLCYPLNLSVVQAAAELVALALAYQEKYITKKSNVQHLFSFTKHAFDTMGSVDSVRALRPVIITASRQSPTFAVSLFSYVVKTAPKNKQMAWKIATLVSSACPRALASRLSGLKNVEGSDDGSDDDLVIDEVTAHLSSTIASSAGSSSESMKRCISLSEGITNPWTIYKLVRHSFITGNFGFARHILNQRQLPQGCSQQQHYLWLTTLSQLSDAEEILGDKGDIGLSDALEVYNSCHSTLSTLAAVEATHRSPYESNPTNSKEIGKFGFQLEFVRLRIEFLELCTITRSLCSEIILTGGKVPARSDLLKKNIPKCFAMLKAQYISLYRLHGLHHCQQTRTTMRTLIALCCFMSDVGKKALKSKLAATNKPQEVLEQQERGPKGNKLSPMGSLLVRLRVKLEGLGTTLSPSGAMLTKELFFILDTVIRCPIPFPAGFFQIKPIPCSIANISAGPELAHKTQMAAQASTNESGEEIIDVVPGIPFTIVVSGVLPEDFAKSANVPFSQVIAWKSTHYQGQLYEDDDVDTPASSDYGEDMQLNVPLQDDPHSAALLSRCQFILPMMCGPILREGYYTVTLKLGCRDVRCDEWLVPTTESLELNLRVEDCQ